MRFYLLVLKFNWWKKTFKKSFIKLDNSVWKPKLFPQTDGHDYIDFEFVANQEFILKVPEIRKIFFHYFGKYGIIFINIFER